MTTITVPDPEALADGRADDVLPLYVAGRWEAAADGAAYESFEPATGTVWARVAAAGPADVDRAVEAARMQHYTQTKSVWVDLQEDPADWFGDAR